jgi:hypothetical protein
MNILIIGASGNMGKRYSAIVSYLGHRAVCLDINNDIAHYLAYHKGPAIIASPTAEHLVHIEQCLEYSIPCLCEKPLHKNNDPEYISDLEMAAYGKDVDIRMVCNWKFAYDIARNEMRGILPECSNSVSYNCWNTGKDGIAWDCIQLFHFDASPELKNDSPYLIARINNVDITEKHIAQSYVEMIKAWLSTPNKLWDLNYSTTLHRLASAYAARMEEE